MLLLRGFLLVAIALLVFGACAEDTEQPLGDEGASVSSGDCPEGVKTTDSGLKYEDIECGEGDAAGRGDTVNVKYRGTLEDGSEFDSGIYAFQLGGGGVIAGWEEGIPGMKVGGKRQLIIPPELGYGAQGYPPAIPPDATLIFDVELLEIQDS